MDMITITVIISIVTAQSGITFIAAVRFNKLDRELKEKNSRIKDLEWHLKTMERSRDSRIKDLEEYLKIMERSRDSYKSKFEAAYADGLALANELDILSPKPIKITGRINMAGKDVACLW